MMAQYTDEQLLLELIRRNGKSPASNQEGGEGSFCCIIGVGRNDHAKIIMWEESFPILERLAA